MVLAAVISVFDNLREKRSVSLTKESGTACFKNSCGTPVENRWPRIISAAFNFIRHKSSAEALTEKSISKTPFTKEMSTSTRTNFRIPPKGELYKMGRKI